MLRKVCPVSLHSSYKTLAVFCFGQMTHCPSACISGLSFFLKHATLWHCLITSCLGSYSRTSTICSIWCVPRELLPAPPSPPAALVTSLRRPRQVPRWVVHALLLPFPSFHQWLVSFHHPGPCCNTTPASSLLSEWLHENMLTFKTFVWQPLQNSNSPSTGQHSQPSTGEGSDRLRNRNGPFPDHHTYLQYMQK